MNKYAQVIVDISNQDIDRLFTYAIPEHIGGLRPGMRVFVPFGRQKNVEGLVLRLSLETDLPSTALKPISAVPDAEPVLTDEQIELALWMKQKYHAGYADVVRLFIPAGLRAGRVRTQYISMLHLEVSAEQLETVLKKMRAGTKAYRILSALAEYGDMERAQITHLVGECGTVIKRLVSQGYIALYRVERQRSPYLDIAPQRAKWHTLNSCQQKVLDSILQEREHFFVSLLHGVTGSGKTEVYMQAIKSVVNAGKTAIVLVPEISLTPQMVLNFRKKLGDGIAILHSALGDGERFDEWRRILNGEARIVIGARSAVFAPCRNVGIIIVDEEHEGSYISEIHPRYDAVEVAIKRGEYNSCPVILGSATPSVVRYYKAVQGQYRLFEMPERVNGKRLPPVEIIDMAEEFSKGNRSIFSGRLYELMQETLAEHKQIMLFLNRRGYSSFVMCRACGETITCQNCDVSLTYHYHINKLRCHYCGYELPLPQICPVCGSKFIKQFGAGTQKVEEEFLKLFPQSSVVRMDVDTTRGKDAHYHLLKKLADGSAQALIGTQMIAKGHDFPNVTLVGVIAADGMLRLPDYRSRERTFSLLTQVAGRAGRGESRGRVVVQTYSPRHFVIECAARHDYKAFYAREIEQRRAMWYPPFARVVRVLYSSADAESAYEGSVKAFERVRQILEKFPDEVLYQERTAAPINRLRELYRHQIMVKLKEGIHCNEIVDQIFAALEGIAGKELYCDIQENPVNLF